MFGIISGRGEHSTVYGIESVGKVGIHSTGSRLGVVVIVNHVLLCQIELDFRVKVAGRQGKYAQARGKCRQYISVHSHHGLHCIRI